MKRVNNIYKNICNLDNIIYMTNMVCKNTKNKKKVNNFEKKKIEHIINIKSRLDNNNYKNYNFNINILKYNYFRINKIINYLNDNLTNDINDKLDLFEDIIKY